MKRLYKPNVGPSTSYDSKDPFVNDPFFGQPMPPNYMKLPSRGYANYMDSSFNAYQPNYMLPNYMQQQKWQKEKLWLQQRINALKKPCEVVVILDEDQPDANGNPIDDTKKADENH